MTGHNKRFKDQNLRISDFYDEVVVICPACSKNAIAKSNTSTHTARLWCLHCGHNKEVSKETTIIGIKTAVQTAAHTFFNAELWLQHPFKNETFWAYNQAHLEYLENYISANLREHKDRTHFTLLEKLPKFYHEAKKREALLKIIEKLKHK